MLSRWFVWGRAMSYHRNKKAKVAQSRLTLCNPMGCMCPTRLLCPWHSPGKNTEVGSHSILEGIFPTKGSNPGLPHCRQILHHLSHLGSPTQKPFPIWWQGHQQKIQPAFYQDDIQQLGGEKKISYHSNTGILVFFQLAENKITHSFINLSKFFYENDGSLQKNVNYLETS